MKETVFRALTNYDTPAAALAAKPTNGQAWLLNETQIFQNGTMPASYGSGRKNNNQTKRTSLRHRIHYYVTDSNQTAGYRQVFDILESDIGSQKSKTVTKVGKTVVATRDDDDRRDIIADPDFS